jgi:hypothetical protein
MKRINPTTNAPFKYGDVRTDGFRFFNYKTKVGSNGFRYEQWLSPDAFALAEKRDRYMKHKKRRQSGKPVRMTQGKRARLKEKQAVLTHV